MIWQRIKRMVSGLQIGLWGCGFLVLTAGLAQAAPASKLPVAATIVPLGDFCRHLGGDLVEVQVLIPPGASPHVFEPSPSVMAKAAQVRVFVYIGAGMEPWAVKVLQARETGKVTVVEASRGLHLIREVGEPHPGETPGAKPHRPEGDGNKETHEHHKDHCHEAGNPHVWLDPVLAQDICRRIAAAFMEADPPNRDRYEANLKSYLAALEELHQEIQRQSAAFKIRDFISFHPSFTYFARRYGLREMGVMEEAPGREPTPRHLQGLVKTIRNSGLKAVFAEPQLNPRIAETLAREAGVQVLMLDPVGGRPPYGSDYLQMMRHNLAVLTAGMK